jgi:dihydroorotate dehydrogenase (NAD+) catalytic subunit
VVDVAVQLGPLALRSPLVAASGTVGSVVDFAAVGALEAYGAATAKSVSEREWPGRPQPRLAPIGPGMLNAIGIQNPGITEWARRYGPQIAGVGVPVWGSVVGHTPREFGGVAAAMSLCPVAAVEINLSCPNLDDGRMFALDAAATGSVVSAVRAATALPIGAKLSPNAPDIVDIAVAAVDAGADWLVLTNTVLGLGIDVEHRRPLLAAGPGGYSGTPIKPLALRCVWEVHRAMPEVPIVGCGGVRSGTDVVEYLLAGASAVALGTVHFAEPRAGRRIRRELERWCSRHGVGKVAELTGGAKPW